MGTTLLPDRERRHLLQFHFVPRLTYGVRLSVTAVFIVAGLAAQILWPSEPNAETLIWSLPLILIGNLLLVVKGYDLSPNHETTSGTWEATTLERFNDIPRMERETRRWDETFADVTCTWGFLSLVGTGALVGFIFVGMADASVSAPWAPVFLGDALVLLLPHWITGLRRAWRPVALTQQVAALQDAIQVVQSFSGAKCEIKPMLEMTGEGESRAPIGARVFLSFPDAPKDFLGVQFQVALNNVYVDSNTAASSYVPASWGGDNTYEVCWEMKAQNGGSLYIDDLYWDAELHGSYQESERLAREADARMNNFGTTSAPSTFAMNSPITKIFLVNSAHTDIGFTDKPSVVSADYVTMIDDQLSRLDIYPATPQYKWTIETTWQLEQWLAQATALEKTKLWNYVRAGRIGIGATHSTLHSSKAGSEEVPRLLYNAQKYRSQENAVINTALHDDVPGVAWTYPQVLAESGVTNLLTGCNMFIGGAFDMPYDKYVFNWEGPDGASVLTQASKYAYVEAFSDFGFPFVYEGFIDKAALSAKLATLVSQGYPYDAIVLQYSFDNAAVNFSWDCVRYWNAYCTDLQIQIARPDEFFSYIVANYAGSIPTETGDWTCIWDTTPDSPQSSRLTKNWRSLGLTSQNAWSILADLSAGTYPLANFDKMWDSIVTIEEHSGGGGGDGYFNQTDLDASYAEHWQFAKDIEAAALADFRTGITEIADENRTTLNHTFTVFNPLSWERTDVVRIPVTDAVYNSVFELRDMATDTTVKYQKYLDQATTKIISFVASSVPSVGVRRYKLIDGTNPTNTSLVVGSNYIENSFYRVEVNSTTGEVTRVYDKTASKELLDTGDTYDFNGLVTATNQQYFFGLSTKLTIPNAQSIATGLNGPVVASLKITWSTGPRASSEIVMYDGIDRIDIVNTMDRSRLQYSPLSENSRYYATTFPFLLSNAKARIETAAGWLDPDDPNEQLGEYKQAYNAQNCVNMSEASYGVSLATPDLWAFSFGNLGTTGGPDYNPVEPTPFMHLIRYADEAVLEGGGTGAVNEEPGAPNQWSVLASFRPHRQAFAPTREIQFGSEICQPLQGQFAAQAAANGTINANTRSFFSTNAANVAITAAKKPNWGSGTILRLTETAGTATTVTVSSGAWTYTNIKEITPTEEDITTLYDNQSGTNSIQLFFYPHQIRTLRLD